MPPRARRSVIWYRPSSRRPTRGSPTVVAVTPAPNTVGKLAVLAVSSSLRVSSYGPGHGAPGPGDSSTPRGCPRMRATPMPHHPADVTKQSRHNGYMTALMGLDARLRLAKLYLIT